MEDQLIKAELGLDKNKKKKKKKKNIKRKEQNRTFLDNFKYDYWILHKKLVCDEIVTIYFA